MDALTAGAVEAVSSLAAKHGVTIEVEPAGSSPDVLADEALLRQLLIQVLSIAVQAARPGAPVRLNTAVTEERLDLTVSTAVAYGLPAEQLESARRLAETLRLAWAGGSHGR